MSGSLREMRSGLVSKASESDERIMVPSMRHSETARPKQGKTPIPCPGVGCRPLTASDSKNRSANFWGSYALPAALGGWPPGCRGGVAGNGWIGCAKKIQNFTEPTEGLCGR